MVALKAQFDADPSYIDEAPYDEETKGILRKMFAPLIVEKEVIKEVIKEAKVGRGRPTKDVALSSEDQTKIQTGIKTLMDELEALGAGEATLDTGARIQIIKTKAALHKELLQMQERVFNIKNTSQFQEVVLAILSDLISEADREVFLQRISPYRD